MMRRAKMRQMRGRAGVMRSAGARKMSAVRRAASRAPSDSREGARQ